MGLWIHQSTVVTLRRARRRNIRRKRMESHLGLIDQAFNACYSSFVREALDDLTDNFTITDPCISGHPIVFASCGFLKMTGYSKNEVIGRNGRVFQGPETNRRSIMEIREAIREEKSLQINLLNYRKDGTPFWMLFHLSPVFSKEDGRVIHFVAVQVPISRKSKGFGTGSGWNGVNLGEDESRMREILFGSCRREVCAETVAELSRVRALDSFVDADNRGLVAEVTCEASDLEKQKAATAFRNILSVLSHYSELTGRLVCGKRCNLAGMGSLGYARHEVLGRNCRFLNGPDTDPKAICQISESIRTEQMCTIRILNYRKDKSSFWNLLHIAPVRNASGKIAFYVGVQIEERSKNEGSQGLSPEMRQLSVVGAVKVAVRTLSIGAGPSHS